MVLRDIIKIDEEKCDGCGLCVPSCAEGALQIVDGKAKLISDKYCDGLGACLSECPQDAITIEKRDVNEFDEKAVHEHLQKKQSMHSHGGMACPSAQPRTVNKKRGKSSDVRLESELAQWPIQLNLVPPTAPYLEGADLLVTADCVPFAYANFHQDFLKGKPILIGCPKLDDAEFYKEKLTEIFKYNDIKSVTVVNMEVPCCFGLDYVVKDAIKASGKDIPYKQHIITIGGEKQ